MEMERIHAQLDLEPSTGGFSGYAAVFNNIDAGGERILPGAFRDSLPEFRNRHSYVFWQHDPAKVIAFVTDISEDDYGLAVAAQWHSTPTAQEARAVVVERAERGLPFGLSIGYRIPEGGAEYTREGIREISRIELLECSLVSLAMNPLAATSGAKCLDCGPSCGVDRPLSADEYKEMVAIQHESLDRELSRLGDMVSYRRALASDYAERGQGWAEVPSAEVCPDLRQKAEVALLAAAVDLWISPPPLRFFAEATSSDEIVFKAPLLWGTYRDGAVFINDSPGHDVVKTVSHEMFHAAHAGAEELVAGSEEAAALDYGDRAAARWHSQ